MMAVNGPYDGIIRSRGWQYQVHGIAVPESEYSDPGVGDAI